MTWWKSVCVLRQVRSHPGDSRLQLRAGGPRVATAGLRDTLLPRGHVVSRSCLGLAQSPAHPELTELTARDWAVLCSDWLGEAQVPSGGGVASLPHPRECLPRGSPNTQGSSLAARCSVTPSPSVCAFAVPGPGGASCSW